MLEKRPQAGLSPQSRVCDRCIRKKIKCDLKHPRCSACVEVGWNCTYSHTRRKPGPTKGSRRRNQHDPTPRSNTDNSMLNQAFSVNEENIPSQMLGSNGTLPPLACESNIDALLLAPILSISPEETLGSLFSQLVMEQRRELAENFAATINVSFPLFRTRTFLDQLADGTMYNTLPSIIYAISAKLMGDSGLCQGIDIDAALGYLVSTATVETEGTFDQASLNQWRTSCLLAWYGFHQYPGKGEAVRITVLVRKAYQCGLHQIDSEENQASFGWDIFSEETLEDWRHVWWCLYYLDCYASFSTATPHQVEAESLRTALLRETLLAEDNNGPSEKVFLPAEQEVLWKTVQDIANIKGDKALGLHIAVSTLLKEIVITHRLYKQNPCQSIRERMLAFEDRLSAVQLALPPNYMRHTRDLFGESDASYYHRLLTLLKTYSMQLLLRLPIPLPDTAQWQMRWQENLEICYRMFAVIQQWGTPCGLAIDPAVCFIALSLLVFLHLHSLSSGVSNPPLREQINRRKNIIRLFLQRYATCWALPRFLLSCYDALLRKFDNSLRSEDINWITSQFQGPLHQKWLNFLPLTLEEQPPTYNVSVYTNISLPIF